MQLLGRAALLMGYVNSDASFCDGWAGIVYESAALDCDSQIVAASNNAKAELRAAVRRCKLPISRRRVRRSRCDSLIRVVP